MSENVCNLRWEAQLDRSWRSAVGSARFDDISRQNHLAIYPDQYDCIVANTKSHNGCGIAVHTLTGVIQTRYHYTSRASSFSVAVWETRVDTVDWTIAPIRFSDTADQKECQTSGQVHSNLPANQPTP